MTQLTPSLLYSVPPMLFLQKIPFNRAKSIAHLTGILKKSTPEQVVLDVTGVGYRIGIPLSLFSKLPP